MNLSNKFNQIKDNDCYDCGDTASIMIYSEGVLTYLCEYCDRCRKKEINDEQPVTPRNDSCNYYDPVNAGEFDDRLCKGEQR